MTDAFGASLKRDLSPSSDDGLKIDELYAKSRNNRSLVLPNIDPSVALVQAMRGEEKHRATV